MEKNPLSKEELVKQLRAIAKKKVIIRDNGMKALVNFRADIITESCDYCGNEYRVSDFAGTHTRKIEIVENIKSLGYDADLEFVCTNCAIKRGLIDLMNEIYSDYCNSEYGNSEYGKLHKISSIDEFLSKYYGGLYPLIKFKARGQDEWHLAIAADDDYKAVIAFLKNEPTYETYDFSEHKFCLIALKNKLDIIKRMTGISIE